MKKNPNQIAEAFAYDKCIARTDRHIAILRVAQSEDLIALANLARAHCGGLSQPRTWARSVIAQVRRNGIPPAHYIHRDDSNPKIGMLMCLRVSWKWSGRKQIADIDHMPMCQLGQQESAAPYGKLPGGTTHA